MRQLGILISAFGLFAAGCGDGGAALCKGVTGPCIGIPAGTAESDVQADFVKVAAGGTLVFDKGTFAFQNGVNVATKNVTVKGQGMDVTVLDFSSQKAGSQGVYCNRDGFTLSDLTVENTFGNAVKVEGATGVTFRNVHVDWQSADLPNHGPYGLYPVQCTNVLMEGCKVEGASDSGVYVGQSNEIVVRNNTVDNNVAGIEIENSHDADVYGNTAQDNTAGILVFALPNLQMTTTKNVRVYQNMMLHNNHPTFASNGDIVARVPAGVGFMVMAADSVEVFGNTIADNETAQSAIISYYVADQHFNYKAGDAYYVFPTNVWFHDNTYTGGGDKPDKTNVLGVALANTSFPNHLVSSVVWDGIVDPARANMGQSMSNTMSLCLSNNGAATFANLKADQMSMGAVSFDMATFDATPFQCMLAPLPAVSFPGLS